MKRAISITLVVAMLLLTMSGTVFAVDADALVITGNNAVVKPGETAVITLQVEQNPGFMGMSFLPVIRNANGEELTWEWQADTSNSAYRFDMNTGTMVLLTADGDCAGTGVLLDMQFLVGEEVEPGVYTISFQLYRDECFNEELDSVSVELPTVTVTVVGCLHENTENVGIVDATCTTNGYTGDTVCNDCGETISKGESIPATGHSYVNGSCAYCGELNPDGAHAGTKADPIPFVIGDNTGVASNSSTDKFCYFTYTAEKDGTATMVSNGTDWRAYIYLNGDDATGDITGGSVYNPKNDGGSTITYELQAGDVLVLKISPYKNFMYGGEITVIFQFTPAGGDCGHANDEVRGALAASCENDGYTGDVVCADCGQIISKGQTILAFGHKDEDEDGHCDYGCGFVYPELQDALLISAESVMVLPGNTATIALIVEQNPGVQGMAFAPVITDANGAKVMWNWTAKNKTSDIEFTLDAKKTIVLSADENIYDTGLLLEIEFTVGEDVTLGEYTITFALASEDGCLRIVGIDDAERPVYEDVPCSLPTVTIRVCHDENKDHSCDDCGVQMGEHTDANHDHACDYGCQESIGACEDADKDHACDYGCDKYYGKHEDTNKDHACDYGCKASIGTCEDADKDHFCDYGCGKYYGKHEDTNKDHGCDYGCSVKDFGAHEDTDKDHGCDYGCSVKDFGVHEDQNTDHACDYGCKESIGVCGDTNRDHACDYGCDKYYGEHGDEAPKDHNCDYGCTESIGEHMDSPEDGDHVCDYGCGEVLEACSDVDGDGNHNCDICGREYATEHQYKPADCLNLATCYECGATEGELGPHSYDSVINVAPETARTGVLNAKCAVCGDKVVVILPAFNTTDYTYEVIKSPTAFADGIGYYTWNETVYGYFGFNEVIRHEIPETDAQVIIESETVMSGNTLRLEMVLKNNPGVQGILAYLKYDTSVLTLVSVENGTVLPTLDVAKALVWTADEDCVEDGVLCVLEFQVAEGVPAGNYPIQLTFAEVLNEDFEEVALHAAFASVTVINVIYGDANGDGKVTLRDALLLRQYFANQDLETGVSTVIVEPGADANGDGKLTLRDALLLRQYFANQDLETGESSVVLGPR